MASTPERTPGSSQTATIRTMSTSTVTPSSLKCELDTEWRNKEHELRRKTLYGELLSDPATADVLQWSARTGWEQHLEQCDHDLVRQWAGMTCPTDEYELQIITTSLSSLLSRIVSGIMRNGSKRYHFFGPSCTPFRHRGMVHFNTHADIVQNRREYESAWITIISYIFRIESERSMHIGSDDPWPTFRLTPSQHEKYTVMVHAANLALNMEIDDPCDETNNNIQKDKVGLHAAHFCLSLLEPGNYYRSLNDSAMFSSLAAMGLRESNIPLDGIYSYWSSPTTTARVLTDIIYVARIIIALFARGFPTSDEWEDDWNEDTEIWKKEMNNTADHLLLDDVFQENQIMTYIWGLLSTAKDSANGKNKPTT